MDTEVRVLVADDQEVVREGLVLLLNTVPGITVVGDAADGEQAVQLVAELHPDVVLMDLGMPRRDGVSATRLIRAEHPDTQVVVLTTYATDDLIVKALDAGALGYLTKSATKQQIGTALRAAADGQAVLDPSVQQSLVRAAGGAQRPAPRTDGLTAREADVLRLIGAGQGNQEIARGLFVSQATVKTHVNRIFAKTGSRDRAEAARYAREHGYLD